ncbi:MAG: cytochrome D1 domain-containing protein [Thermoguttaceae bacterium]|jgi:YVTN family beta-propeller protein
MTCLSARRFCVMVFSVSAMILVPTFAPAAAYLGPSAVSASADGKILFVACADARQIAVVDPGTQKTIRTIDVPAEPTALAISADGKTLYVTCAAAKSTVCAIDIAAGKIVRLLPAGHTATGVAVAQDGSRLWVCNRFNDNVLVLDAQSGREIARVPVIREPVAAVLTPNGKSLWVINHLPLDRANLFDVAAAVTVIDTATNQAATIRLPNGSSSLRGLCLSPDGKRAYAVHILSRYQMPTTQLERGWMNTNAMSVLDVEAKKLINTVLLDDVDLGAAKPWGVAVSADGKQICVSHAGSHELSVIDAEALLDKLARLAGTAGGGDRATYGGSLTAADVPNDLSFLVGLRRRIRLDGNGPRGLALVGSKVYVAEYFTDTLGFVDLQSQSAKPASQIALGPKPQLSLQRRGEMLFNDAEMCFQHWQSCESCHPDARMDGLNWDLVNDGLGNPKNTRSLVKVHDGGPAMSLGVRTTAEEAVRAGITHILFAVRPEADAQALDAYLKSLEPLPSPYLVDGKLSPAAERGKQLFFSARLGCGTCHPAPLYCDLRTHDVGSAGKYDKPTDKFNTPRLIEVWRTAPYMHDGQYLTIKELFVQGQHGIKGDCKFSEQEMNDLVQFVLSL